MYVPVVAGLSRGLPVFLDVRVVRGNSSKRAEANTPVPVLVHNGLLQLCCAGSSCICMHMRCSAVRRLRRARGNSCKRAEANTAVVDTLREAAEHKSPGTCGKPHTLAPGPILGWLSLLLCCTGGLGATQMRHPVLVLCVLGSQVQCMCT